MAFVQILKPLQALDEILPRYFVVFGIEQVHYTGGEQNMRYQQMGKTEGIKLPIDPDESRHVVSCIDAGVAGMNVGVDEVDFEQRPEKMDNDRIVEHARSYVSFVISLP